MTEPQNSTPDETLPRESLSRSAGSALWVGQTVETVLSECPWFDAHAIRDYGHFSKSELLHHIAGETVRMERAVEINIRLRSQLEQWVQNCYCVQGGAKCLLCETRELLEASKPNVKVSDERPMARRMRKHSGVTAGVRSLHRLVRYVSLLRIPDASEIRRVHIRKYMASIEGGDINVLDNFGTVQRHVEVTGCLLCEPRGFGEGEGGHANADHALTTRKPKSAE